MGGILDWLLRKEFLISYEPKSKSNGKENMGNKRTKKIRNDEFLKLI